MGTSRFTCHCITQLISLLIFAGSALFGGLLIWQSVLGSSTKKMTCTDVHVQMYCHVYVWMDGLGYVVLGHLTGALPPHLESHLHLEVQQPPTVGNLIPLDDL